jgi:hypothetical protein
LKDACEICGKEGLGLYQLGKTQEDKEFFPKFLCESCTDAFVKELHKQTFYRDRNLSDKVYTKNWGKFFKVWFERTEHTKVKVTFD